MSEQPPEAPAAQAEDQADDTEAAPTLQGLAAKVDGLASKLDQLLSGPAPATGTAAAAERSVAQEVRDELAKLQAAEKRKAASDAEKGKLAELEDKVKKITEKAPVEHRRSTRVMRWAD